MALQKSIKAQWAMPGNAATKDAGMIFTGMKPATEDDWVALEALLRRSRDEVKVDKRTLVGRWNAAWTSEWQETHKNARMGGLGSTAYQTQKVGKGVQFAKKKIWHNNADGKFVKEIPANCGAYHHDRHLDIAIAGPKPGSQADRRLHGRNKKIAREYFWDKQHEWYGIRKVR